MAYARTEQALFPDFPKTRRMLCAIQPDTRPTDHGRVAIRQEIAWPME